MLRNIKRVAMKKRRELRPRRKGLKSFGSAGVGINKVVDIYAT